MFRDCSISDAQNSYVKIADHDRASDIVRKAHISSSRAFTHRICERIWNVSSRASGELNVKPAVCVVQMLARTA